MHPNKPKSVTAQAENSTPESELKNPLSLRSKKKFAAMSFAAAVFYILMELKYEHFLIMRYRFELKEKLKHIHHHTHGKTIEFTTEELQKVSTEINQLKNTGKKIEKIMHQIEECKYQLDMALEPVKALRKTQVNEITQTLSESLNSELKKNNLPPHLLSIMINSIDAGLSERPTITEARVMYLRISEDRSMSSDTSIEKTATFDQPNPQHFAQTYTVMDELIIREKIKNAIHEALTLQNDQALGKPLTEALINSEAFHLTQTIMKNIHIGNILIQQTDKLQSFATEAATKKISGLFNTLAKLNKEGEKIHKETHQELKNSHAKMTSFMNHVKQTKAQEEDQTPVAKTRSPSNKT